MSRLCLFGGTDLADSQWQFGGESNGDSSFLGYRHSSGVLLTESMDSYSGDVVEYPKNVVLSGNDTSYLGELWVCLMLSNF
jgi:hypothetical protein